MPREIFLLGQCSTSSSDAAWKSSFGFTLRGEVDFGGGAAKSADSSGISCVTSKITHRNKSWIFSWFFIPCSFEALSESYLDLTCVIFFRILILVVSSLVNVQSVLLWLTIHSLTFPLHSSSFFFLFFSLFFSTWLELFNYYYFSNFFMISYFSQFTWKIWFLHEFHEQINSKTPLSSLVLLGAVLDFLFFELFNIFSLLQHLLHALLYPHTKKYNFELKNPKSRLQ